MRSFKRQPDNRRSIYLQLAGSIEGQIRQAYAKCHEDFGVTQASIAEKLGVDRSVVHRRLSGRTNMTIETIADMVWALGHCINVDIFDPKEKSSNGFMIKPEEPIYDPQKRINLSIVDQSVALPTRQWEIVE